VRLVECPNTSAKRYRALSHFPGAHQSLCTNKENYEAHKQSILFLDLPKPFQAAVTVTKHLGVEYLWIDSFCIIQNSAEDWERECSRMASICTGALVTIAASSAIGSSKGFLRDYFPTKFGSFKLPNNNKDEHSVVPPTIEYSSWRRQNITYGSHSRLFTREWVLQEWLLSERTLSFWTGCLVWGCTTHCRSDDLYYPYSLNHIKHNMVNKRSIRSLDIIPVALEYRYDLAQTYPGCELSKTTDRLPALSSLAQALSPILNDTNAASLWISHIRARLAWHCSHAVEILSLYVASETSRRYISKGDIPASGPPS
jgi:hypothetical protein